jgi:hypothetical protein
MTGPFNNRCTMLTALFDIGRAGWQPPYDRKIEYYLSHMRKTLSLRCSMVVLVDPQLVDPVRAHRRVVDPRLSHTKIRITSPHALPMAPRLDAIRAVLASDTYRARRDNLSRLDRAIYGCRPETLHPVYNVLIHSKTGLLRQVAEENPFDSEFFAWSDAGLCRERFPPALFGASFPNPERLQCVRDNRVHIGCRSLPAREDLDYRRFFQQGLNRIAAGWFVGTADAVRRMDDACRALIDECLAAGTFDGEQGMYAICSLRDPVLFTFHYGNWYDAFFWFAGL